MTGLALSAGALAALFIVAIVLTWRRWRRVGPPSWLGFAATDLDSPERRKFLPRVATALLGLMALKPTSSAAHLMAPLTDEDFDLDLRLSSSKAPLMQAQSKTDCCPVASHSPSCTPTCQASCHGSCGASCTPTCHNTCAHSCVGTCGGASCAPTCTQACRIRQTMNCPVPPPR